MGLILSPSLVEIGLTDLTKFVGAKAQPGTPGLKSTLRIKEKESLFVDGRNNFTISFSEKKCDFENDAQIKDGSWNGTFLQQLECRKFIPTRELLQENHSLMF